MTVICAYVDQAAGVTWIGSDTHAYSGDIREPCGPKWCLHGEWAIGQAGNLRALNVLGHNIATIVEPDDSYDIARALRTVLGEDGYERNDKDRATDFGECFLLARAGRVWSIGPDFSVLDAAPFYAEGCGRELALGAYHALRHHHHVAHRPGGELVCRAAIEAAVAFHVNCGGEAWVRALRPRASAQVATIAAAA